MSRFDSIGLFWQDLPTSRKRSEQDRPRPEVPETGWKKPDGFPNLTSATVLSLDTETWDPDLETSGPGWARGRGHVVGFSVGAQDAQGNTGKWYFPVRHADTPEDNMDPEHAFAWLRETLSVPGRPVIFANAPYDVGWLHTEDIEINGPIFDIQFAEALLNEAAKVSLEAQAQKYLGVGKTSNLLYQWCADAFGGNPTERQRKNIWRSPPSLVGHYAEDDAALPMQIMTKQWPLLVKESLLDLFFMECELIPLMMAMRLAGVSVDIPRAEELYERMGGQVLDLQSRLQSEVGFSVNVNSSDDLARAFRAHGIPYGMTAPSANAPEGKPSFTAGFLDSVEHPLAQLIVDIRQREKLRGTFIKSYLLDNHVNGKVHGTFNQLRGEGGGTRSGRFSSSDPNLQNIPTRTQIGKEIRRLFVHDVGHVGFRKYDYSQIEYRFLAHFAVGEGSDEVRARYASDPDTDYHVVVHDLILEMSGIDLIRGHTKNMNFGMIYGMGEPELIRQLGVTTAVGKNMFSAYHKGAPYAKATMKATSAEAEIYGTITTILGRKSRFDMWEPDSYSDKRPATSYANALMRYGKIRRAYTHKALNRRLQGSAADQMKMAMHKCWKDGIFAETGVPRLTVHDELDFSDPGGKDAAFDEMKNVMENVMKLRVPVRADYEIGPNWGDVKAPT